MVIKGVITEAEAETFTTDHDAIQNYRTEHPEMTDNSGNATEREAAIRSALVAEGTITQEQADVFPDIHDRLGNAGLMP